MPSALAIFTCRPNSHPFQERHVYLDEPVKIGRSVARCRPAQNNATFDCKVLSRNHALIWFDHKTGKFYLQDTKSSNGTFINSQRLSRGSEESPPCELLSGDIIQFGVDVTENTRKGKVTHGCIVSTVKLFMPDGMEGRRRSDVIQAPLPLPVEKVAANSPSMYSQELFQLSQYLQEALHREQMLEQKLATLQRLLANTQEASDSSWQALIDEDRLLSRLEVMGNQLQAYSKNQTEDGIRKELVTLQEDKHSYETTAKESLRRVLQEKIEVVRKLSEVERSLSNTEDECTHLKEMNDRTQEELRELANKYNGAVNEIKEFTDKLKHAEGKQEEIQQKALSEKKELQHRIDEMEEKEQLLQARIEALQADNDFTNERLTALQVRLEQLQEKNIKDHNSIGIQVDDLLPKINGSTDKEHFLLKSGGDCSELFQQFIECKNRLKAPVDSTENSRISNVEENIPVIPGISQVNQSSYTFSKTRISLLRERDQNSNLTKALYYCTTLIAEDHHTKGSEKAKLLKENQLEAKESDMSDTLSPSKDRSSEDTTDYQMDEQELNESLTKVSLLKDLLAEARASSRKHENELDHLKYELRRAHAQTGDSEREIQQLHQELKEAQELAITSKQKCFEVQALLEEERKTAKLQIEESTRQIQVLQAQLHKLQKNIEIVREEKENEIIETRDQLASTHKEIVALRQTAVEAATGRENDIAILRGELQKVQTELEHWRQTTSQYEAEIFNLQTKLHLQTEQQKNKEKGEAIQLQGKLDELQKQSNGLQNDCDSLRQEKVILTEKLQWFVEELQCAQQQSVKLTKDVSDLEISRKELEVQVGMLKEQRSQETKELRVQLAQAENETQKFQQQYEANQTMYLELKEKLDKTQQENESITEELENCKENLKLLQQKGNNPSTILQPIPALGVALILAFLYWWSDYLW
ncbi:sarcolemma associated protein a isoform X3 [Stegostoma tigrinum]|uniref:sarcolemma associated protein a isoform X3 n=1 Tax=Stegostoma tigrinum TaxID=3053191 RepID=UPI00202B837D|nr:sarcolemma associated protein a isoform X3 [Stegostoma tigrinum]